MTFRRSFSKAETGSIHKKAIALTAIVVFFLFLLKLGFDSATADPPKHYISIEVLDRNTFIIQKDTTNYDGFASILKEEVLKARQKHDYNNILVILNLPKKLDSTEDIGDLVQIVDAMDVPFEIKQWN